MLLTCTATAFDLAVQPKPSVNRAVYVAEAVGVTLNVTGEVELVTVPIGIVPCKKVTVNGAFPSTGALRAIDCP